MRISGSKKNYDWGSETLIQDQLGLGAENEKIAEVWFGTHELGPALTIPSGKTLFEVTKIKLPFLAKLLAANSPLSIQAHPTKLQAKQGFQKEESLRIDKASPIRNYKDESDKPEILIALTKFRGLCGFRPLTQIQEILRAFSSFDKRFGELADLADEKNLKQVFSELLQDRELVERFTSLAPKAELDSKALEARDLALELLDSYPSDTGALVAVLLNLVELEPGQAIYLPAGNLHAYLSGLGFEVMGSSDNVVRGGLTTKHVDQQELLAIADFTELFEPAVKPKKLAEGLYSYPVGTSDFQVYRAEVSGSNLLADINLPDNALVFCVDGEVAVSTSLDEREVLKRAEALFASGAKKFSLSGSGAVFIVTGG